MALVKCAQCGKYISDKNERCIHCGCKIDKIVTVQSEENGRKSPQFPISICPECKKTITNIMSNCSNCGFPLDLRNPMICKINGVDYDLTYFYHGIVEQEQTEEQLIEMVKELRDFLDVFEYHALYREIAETKEIPKEFNGQSLKKVMAQRKREEEAKPKIHCKYCGSDNVRPLGPFEKLAIQHIGKEWHCKKCNSDF